MPWIWVITSTKKYLDVIKGKLKPERGGRVSYGDAVWHLIEEYLKCRPETEEWLHRIVEEERKVK